LQTEEQTQKTERRPLDPELVKYQGFLDYKKQQEASEARIKRIADKVILAAVEEQATYAELQKALKKAEERGAEKASFRR